MKKLANANATKENSPEIFNLLPASTVGTLWLLNLCTMTKRNNDNDSTF